MNGGRVVTDRDLYDRLDDQAVREPESFVGIDLTQHRLSLGDSDYDRLTKRQQALAEGKPDPAFERHRLGRLFLEEELRNANIDPNGTEARTAQQQLDRLLGAFESVEGKPPTIVDIRGLVGDVLPRAEGASNIVRVSGGEPFEVNDDTQIAQQQQPARTHRGIAPPTEPAPGSPAFRAAHLEAVGEIVRLPNGTAILDRNSPTGYVMSPDTDLAKVAADGRSIGKHYASMRSNSDPAADLKLMISLGLLAGHAGSYDYQRKGSLFTGYTQLPHFRNISNINVGLIGQQAGLTLHELLTISGTFAKNLSSNSDPADEYGLSRQTRDYIEEGYRIGSSGVYGQAVSIPGKH
jgi:hypothetical protein